MSPDIKSRADIERLLRSFYTGVFTDDLLGHIFVDVAGMDLDHHLPRLADFWQKVLFNTGEYDGNMMKVHRLVHLQERFTDAHFQRWLERWEQTIDALFAGPVSEAAKVHAERMARAMRRTLDRPPRRRIANPEPTGAARTAESQHGAPAPSQACQRRATLLDR